MYAITYSLREQEKSSEKYYQDISGYTDMVIHTAEGLFGESIHAYENWAGRIPKSDTPSREGSILELLILGVLWKVYSGDSGCLEAFPEGLLVKLSEMRKKNIPLKPGINFLKGIFSTLFLSPDLYDNLNIVHAGMNAMDKLLNWLSATDEFNQEVRHLRLWQSFLMEQPKAEAEELLASVITFALWFEESSEEVLGRYTANVDRFLNEVRPKHYWREDVIFCGRRRVEYHMNMVGAELMNRAFRRDFQASAHKLMILPTCMRLQGEGKCPAEKTGNGLSCKRCTAQCEVCRLSRLGDEMGFNVLMVAHGSSISALKNNDISLDQNTGVVGVSCLLNLISGGWLLEGMGIPAQCVLLDYCGCKAHWHDEGIPTSLNVEKLKQIMTR